MPFSILACWKMAFVFHESTLDMHFFCKRSSFDHFIWTVCCNRKKPLLFYFNIMKCASPMVLLEFQCPTTQVWAHSFFHVVFSSNLLVSFFVFSRFKCFPAASSSATSCLHSACGRKISIDSTLKKRCLWLNSDFFECTLFWDFSQFECTINTRYAQNWYVLWVLDLTIACVYSSLSPGF